MKRVAPSLTLAYCIVAGACGSPTKPSSNGYAGQWSGTTAQGRPIGFTISRGEMVTTITLGHDFNGCSGSQTFSNLSLNIAPTVECIPGPCPGSLSSYRAFSYGTGNPLDGPSTDVRGLFLATDRAEGIVSFRNLPGCGSAVSVTWSANRR